MCYALRQNENMYELDVNGPILPWNLQSLHRIENAETVGLVVNVEKRHWLALRFYRGQIWLLDSVLQDPKPLSFDEYVNFLREPNHRAFAVKKIASAPALPGVLHPMHDYSPSSAAAAGSSRGQVVDENDLPSSTTQHVGQHLPGSSPKSDSLALSSSSPSPASRQGHLANLAQSPDGLLPSPTPSEDAPTQSSVAAPSVRVANSRLQDPVLSPAGARSNQNPVLSPAGARSNQNPVLSAGARSNQNPVLSAGARSNTGRASR